MVRNEDQEKMTVEIPKGQGLLNAEEGHKILTAAFYSGFMFGFNPDSAYPVMNLIKDNEDFDECCEIMYQVYDRFMKAMKTKFFAGNLDDPVDATVFAIFQSCQEEDEDSE